MTLGCLGNIAFEVSTKTVKTIRDAEWSGSVTIQTHQRHLSNALQEFVGIDPEGFSFSIRISKYLGADPLSAVSQLLSYERAGTPVTLVLGSKIYGKYRWLIKKHKTAFEYYDKYGNVIGVDISVTLTEYTKE